MARRPSVALAARVVAVLLTACGNQSSTVESLASDAMPAAFADPQMALANPEASGEDLTYAWFGRWARVHLS